MDDRNNPLLSVQVSEEFRDLKALLVAVVNGDDAAAVEMLTAMDLLERKRIAEQLNYLWRLTFETVNHITELVKRVNDPTQEN